MYESSLPLIIGLCIPSLPYAFLRIKKLHHKAQNQPIIKNAVTNYKKPIIKCVFETVSDAEQQANIVPKPGSTILTIADIHAIGFPTCGMIETSSHIYLSTSSTTITLACICSLTFAFIASLSNLLAPIDYPAVDDYDISALTLFRGNIIQNKIL